MLHDRQPVNEDWCLNDWLLNFNEVGYNMYFATKPRIRPSRQSEAGLLKERTIHDFNRHSQEKRVYSKAMWDRKSLTYKLYEIKTLAAVNLSQYDFS